MTTFRDLITEREQASDGPTKKDVLTSEEFNVALVSLEADQEIAPHPEPYAVFFYVLEGTGVFTTGDGTVELEHGDALHLEPGEERGILCLDPLTILGIQEAH